MTDNTRALVSAPQTELTLQDWQLIQAMAPVFQASRMFGVTIEQAAVVMAKGKEIGLGLATSFEFVHVIDSKPSLSPKGQLALIHQSGLGEVEITKLATGQGAFVGYKCRMRRKDTGFEYTAQFTMDDAKRAGLIKDKSGWDKYPENMCQWRAVGFCADVVFPDLCGGMLRPDDYGVIVDQEGEPIIEQAKPAAKQLPEPPAPDFGLFVAQEGWMDRLLVKCGGVLPTTQDDLTKWVEVLSEEDRVVSLQPAPAA